MRGAERSSSPVVCVWRGAGRGGTMVGRRLYVGETQPCALARVVAEGLARSFPATCSIAGS